jgi:hypothetical protein
MQFEMHTHNKLER